eukprot:jgi/Ulvmu1/11523/UM078_0012.1
MIVDVAPSYRLPEMSANQPILSSLKCEIIKAQRICRNSEGNEGSVSGRSPTRRTWGFSGKQTNSVGVLAKHGSPAEARRQTSVEDARNGSKECDSHSTVEDSNTADWEITPDELTLAAVIAEGEFGIVYKGKWNGTPVAIKVVKASEQINQQQLAAEVGVLRRIHHPNIVQFLGACTRTEPMTIVSEVMEGGSLADALQLRPQPPLRRVLEIALDCTRGLNYLHLANPHAIIHRDLKPSNIMLTKSGTGVDPLLGRGVAKLADFGLSKNITSFLPPSISPGLAAAQTGSSAGPGDGSSEFRDGSSGLGHSSAVSDKNVLIERMFKMTGGTGSHVFMAGEIFRREPYNAKADVYSLAMVMYEMLAGRRPFEEMDAREAALRAACEGLRPQWPPLVSEACPAAERVVLHEAHALVQSCWAADATKRPAASEIIPQLESLIDQLPREQYPRRTPSSKQLRRADGTQNSSKPAAQRRAANAATSRSRPRWSKIKGWGSALSLRKGSDGDSCRSASTSQQASIEGMPVGQMSLRGGGGEGTHVGGRPRSGSTDSLRQLDSTGSALRADKKRLPRPASQPITGDNRYPPARASQPGSGDVHGLLGLLGKLGGPGGHMKAAARHGRSVSRSRSGGVTDGGICRSIAEVERR